MKMLYTRQIADAICERLAQSESLKAICKSDGFPHEATVRMWAREDRDGFQSRFEIARDIGTEGLVDMIIGIASKDMSIIENGTKKIDNAAVSQARLMIDAIKWKAGKQMPAKYGDRIITEITGKDGGPVEVEAIRSSLIERITRIAQSAAIEDAPIESEQARVGSDPGSLETDDPVELAALGNRSTRTSRP
jgi:hypothetical protein